MLLSVCVYRKQCMLSSGDREENINPEEVAKKVKDAAKIIRETSSAARETVRKFYESGAVSELAGQYRKLQLRHKIPRQRLEIQLWRLETAM